MNLLLFSSSIKARTINLHSITFDVWEQN